MLHDTLTRELPETWGASRVRRIGRIVNGGTPTSDEDNWGGDIPFVTPPELRLHQGRVVAVTDRTVTPQGARSGSSVVERAVIVSNRAPIGYVALVSQTSAFNQGCKSIITPPTRINERFLMYSLLASEPLLNALGQGTTFMELSTADLGHLAVPVPPLSEQQAIADFLDRETAKIDALIEKQTALIERLRERRVNVISKGVTVGLRGGGTVRTNDTWFPTIAEGWSLSRIHYGFEVTLGKMLDAGRVDTPDDVVLPYLRAANVQPWGLNLDDINEMPFTTREAAKLSLEADDLLVVEGGSVGTSWLIRQSLSGYAFQKTLNRVRSRGINSAHFLYYVLGHLRERGVFDVLCSGSTIAHLTAEKLRALQVPVPPMAEQQAIADHLDRETAKIDALIAKAERFVEVARERRSSLITAAVTGQLDITGKAA